MPKIEGKTFSATVEWDKDGKPVLYVTGQGSSITPKEAIDVIQLAIDTINAGPYEQVCSVYNVLALPHVPLPLRFVTAGKIPSTPRTAHIVMVTTNPMLRLFASIMAVSGHSKARSFDVCETVEDMNSAVQSWLASLNKPAF